MYNGRYSGNKRRLHRKRQFVLAASIALLLVGMVGGTLAWLTANTRDVNNEFTAAEVPPTIEETKPEENGNVKEHVSVKNDGNITAYIRAAVAVNWLDDKGNIVADPEDHTYDINYATGTGWVDGNDGFYYYTKPVAAGGSTGKLITSAYPTSGTKYKLQIDIVAQTIQSEGKDSSGKTPVELAWGENAAQLVGAIE